MQEADLSSYNQSDLPRGKLETKNGREATEALPTSTVSENACVCHKKSTPVTSFHSKGHAQLSLAEKRHPGTCLQERLGNRKTPYKTRKRIPTVPVEL